MAVKGKKAQKQQQKPSPKLVKHQEEEAEDEEEEDEDEEEVADEEQSDEEVADEQADKDDEDSEDEEAEEEEKPKQEEPKQTKADDDMQTTVFVGHLNFQLTKKELEDFFSKAGEVQSSRIIAKRGYAFVTFVDAASVEEALKLDKQNLSGKAVHIERVKSKRTDNSDKKQLKRKHNKEANEKNAKKAKLGDKTVQLKKGPNKPKGGKGRPKTAQHTNPNKKGNKPKGGQFVKAQN